MKKNTQKKYSNTRHGFFLVGFFLLSLVFNVVALSSALFFLNIPINVFSFSFAFLFSFVVSGVIGLKIFKFNPFVTLSILAIGVIVFFASIFLNGVAMETTWDGNWYHKSAVGMLKNGWNPVKESAIDFYDSSRNPIKVPRAKFQNLIYENHYTKGSWVFAANIYNITGNIETGHSINLIIMSSVFCLLVSLFLFKTTLLGGILISFITVFNPVAAPQLFLFYNDGLLGLLSIAVIVSLVFIITEKEKEYSKIGFLIFFMASTLLVNTKFTGLLFVVMYSLAFFIYMLAYPPLRQKVSKKFFLTGCFTAIFSIFLVGFSPYISNIQNGLHPLHPLAGPGKIDIMTSNSPREFVNDNRPLAPFLKSLFGKLDSFSNSSEKKVELKNPFSVSSSELMNLGLVDARISGHGIFFSGLFLISIFILFFWLCKAYRSKLADFYIFICIIVPTALIVLLLKEMWWARYLPHLSVVIPLAMYALYNTKKEIYQFLFYGLFFIALINSYLFFAINFEKGTKIMELSSCGNIAQKSQVFYRLSHKSFYGSLFNILDCQKSKTKELKIIPVNKNFNLDKYQSVVLIQGYLEVFYEK